MKTLTLTTSRMRATLTASQGLSIARETVTRSSHALRMNVDDADAWHALGTALAALGDRVGALTALRNAVLLDETRAHSQLALGNLLFDTGRFDDALRCFESAAAGL